MKAILLDRDDTLNEDPGYINDPELVHLKPGVISGLTRLREKGFRFFVMTNQSGLGRGFITPNQLEQVHARLSDLLKDAGIIIEKFYVCPHKDSDGCDCRKPKPGLFARFFQEYNYSPSDCFVIGDKFRDIEAAIDVPGILLPKANTVAGKEPRPKNLKYSAADMVDAADFILRNQQEN